MAKPATVDEYITGFAPPMRELLAAVRGAIQRAVPDAEEAIGYQMPGYRLGGFFIFFAAFRDHYSIFCPSLSEVVDAFPELAAYSIAKGTIRFRLDQPVPVEMIARIAANRAEAQRAKAKPGGRGGRGE